MRHTKRIIFCIACVITDCQGNLIPRRVGAIEWEVCGFEFRVHLDPQGLPAQSLFLKKVELFLPQNKQRTHLSNRICAFAARADEQLREQEACAVIKAVHCIFYNSSQVILLCWLHRLITIAAGAAEFWWDTQVLKMKSRVDVSHQNSAAPAAMVINLCNQQSNITWEQL